ncbi:MAG: hypothetical protein EOP06_09190 [Proteobacteria bacterium]|nr:MAG: hypothetical protein EOP06_09190 [Pseudomonadota bacterium]
MFDWKELRQNAFGSLAADESIVVKRSSGIVRTLEGHEKFWFDLSTDEQPLLPGDTIFTGAGGEALLTYEGGGKLHIKPNSLVVVRANRLQEPQSWYAYFSRPKPTIELEIKRGSVTQTKNANDQIILTYSKSATPERAPASGPSSEISEAANLSATAIPQAAETPGQIANDTSKNQFESTPITTAKPIGPVGILAIDSEAQAPGPGKLQDTDQSKQSASLPAPREPSAQPIPLRSKERSQWEFSVGLGLHKQEYSAQTAAGAFHIDSLPAAQITFTGSRLTEASETSVFLEGTRHAFRFASAAKDSLNIFSPLVFKIGADHLKQIGESFWIGGLLAIEDEFSISRASDSQYALALRRQLYLNLGLMAKLKIKIRNADLLAFEANAIALPNIKSAGISGGLARELKGIITYGRENRWSASLAMSQRKNNSADESSTRTSLGLTVSLFFRTKD